MITAALAGCAERTRAPQVDEQDLTKETSALVVYFTWSGHLDSMAHWIADETGGDILRVLPRDTVTHPKKPVPKSFCPSFVYDTHVSRPVKTDIVPS